MRGYSWLAMDSEDSTYGARVCLYRTKPTWDDQFLQFMSRGSWTEIARPKWLKPRQLWGLVDDLEGVPTDGQIWDGSWWKLVEDHGCEAQPQPAPHCSECVKLEGEIKILQDTIRRREDEIFKLTEERDNYNSIAAAEIESRLWEAFDHLRRVNPKVHAEFTEAMRDLGYGDIVVDYAQANGQADRLIGADVGGES